MTPTTPGSQLPPGPGGTDARSGAGPDETVRSGEERGRVPSRHAATTRLTDDVTVAPVSVVVPAHNAADTLADALVSALEQRPVPLEVVIVDDGSVDATVEVAVATAAALGVPISQHQVGSGDDHDHDSTSTSTSTGTGTRTEDSHPSGGAGSGTGPVVRVLRQPQSGPSGARNTAIDASRGTWVAFLDADDVWHPGKLGTQLALAGAHPDAVVVASDWVRRTGNGPASDLHAAPVGPVSTITEGDLLVLNRFQTSTVLARTDAVRAVGGFDPTIDGVEDWDMWRRLAGQGQILKIDAPLVSYVNRGDSYSKDLVRVYGTAMVMVARAVAELPRRPARRLRAWHHLRFAVAFALLRDWPHASRCFGDVYRAGLLSAVPGAAAKHLAPFLAGRLRRRLRGHHPVAAGARVAGGAGGAGGADG